MLYPLDAATLDAATRDIAAQVGRSGKSLRRWAAAGPSSSSRTTGAARALGAETASASTPAAGQGDIDVRWGA